MLYPVCCTNLLEQLEDKTWLRATIVRRTVPALQSKAQQCTSKIHCKCSWYKKKITITRAWICKEPQKNHYCGENSLTHSVTHQPCQWQYFKCQHCILLLIKAYRDMEAIAHNETVISKEGMCKAIAIWIKIIWLSVSSQGRTAVHLERFYVKILENTVIKHQYKMWKIEDRPRTLKTLIKKQ